MPPPIKVQLMPHDPRWSEAAAAEGSTFSRALSQALIAVHHIGSTAISGISANPILDIIPVVASLEQLDAQRGELERLGYQWWGELGLPGRRYCTRDDALTGQRLAQIHCYANGSPEITRHLAFRDYLRVHPAVARAYDEEKQRCRDLHPDDSHAYSDCKDAWIKRIEAEALAFYQQR